MYLLIDIGNTLHKAAVFSETGELAALHKYRQLTPNRIEQLFTQHGISHAILSAVGQYSSLVEDRIRQHCPLIVLSSSTPLPFRLRYHTPGSLGPDRIANAAGAFRLYPEKNVLSIQLGTCLVCDFINAQSEYLGGSISPGIDMRFKALKHYTRKLPEVKKKMTKGVTGTSTEESILNGVMNGIVFEIEGMIAAYTQQYQDLKVLVTGGDAELLQNSIKFPIFAAPNIVLWGLYEILRYNVDK
ncbi:MAG: type III pantothenate kinase [Bacteroidales bacterium]|nr:type III pantothenate kinase [Bacteroidales bacterium]